VNIIFFGSDTFSVPFLHALIASRHTIKAVVTSPDSKKGRGQQVGTPLLKTIAQEHSLSCFQPTTLKDGNFEKTISPMAVDLFVVVSYGKILPDQILSMPSHYCLNVHPSLLPRYRGPSPIPYALLHGDEKSGYTIIRLNEKIDSGDVAFQECIAVNSGVNAEELALLISSKAAEKLIDVIDSIENDQVKFRSQDDEGVSYAPLIKKNDGCIKWDDSAKTIHNMVRAFVPWPSAYTFFNNKRIKIILTELSNSSAEQSKNDAGKVMTLDKSGFIAVGSREGILIVREVQQEGKKKMNAYEWSKGQHVKEGDFFG